MADKVPHQQEIEYLKAIEESYKYEKEKSDLAKACALSLQETTNNGLVENTEPNVEKPNVEAYDANYDDDLAKAIENSLKDIQKQKTSNNLLNESQNSELKISESELRNTSLNGSDEDEDILRAIEKSLNINQQDESSDDLERAIRISLDDYGPPATVPKESESDGEDIYEKVFESKTAINSNFPKQSSIISPTKSTFDAAHAFKEQNDILAACKQSVIESGIYHNSDVPDNEMNLILNYISHTDNLDNGDELLEMLHHHYDEIIEHEKLVDDSKVDESTEKKTDNQVVKQGWFQGLLQFSATNLRRIVESMNDFAIGKLFPILEKYDIIDVRFLRNLLNGNFDAQAAVKFGFDLLKKLIRLNKLFNEIKALNLKDIDLAQVLSLLTKIGLLYKLTQ